MHFSQEIREAVRAKEIDPEQMCSKFLELAQKNHKFGKIVAHAPYTLNACAAKENTPGTFAQGNDVQMTFEAYGMDTGKLL